MWVNFVRASEWRITRNGDGLHAALGGPVVRDRVVLRRAVVSDRDRVRRSAKATLVFSRLRLPEQVTEQDSALRLVHVVDPALEAGVDE